MVLNERLDEEKSIEREKEGEEKFLLNLIKVFQKRKLGKIIRFKRCLGDVEVFSNITINNTDISPKTKGTGKLNTKEFLENR